MVPEFTWDYKCPMVPGLKWDSVLQLNKGSLNDSLSISNHNGLVQEKLSEVIVPGGQKKKKNKQRFFFSSKL